jgi:hypothetical protein
VKDLVRLSLSPDATQVERSLSRGEAYADKRMRPYISPSALSAYLSIFTNTGQEAETTISSKIHTVSRIQGFQTASEHNH